MNTRGFCALLLLLLPACFSGGISRDCGFGTELDPERGCVTLSTCGPGTIFEEGECIPGGAFACSTGTSLSADGTECIVDVSQCGDGAQLDPSSGRCVATGEVICGSGTEAVGTVCVPSCDGPFEAQNAARTGCEPAARVQVVHAVADGAVSILDVYSDGGLVEVGDDLSFGQATPVFKKPLSVALEVRSPDGVSSFAMLGPNELQAGETYLVVARGLLGTTGFDTTINDTTLTLDPAAGLREEFDIDDSDDDANFALYHAVTDAPAVGVGVQDEFDTVPAAPIYSDVAYGELSAYVALAEGDTAAVDVYAQSSGTRVASVQTSSGSALPVGTGIPEGSGVLVAMGFLNPAANTGSGSEPGAPLQVVAVLPDGTALPLDAAGRVQLVHGAVDAPGSSLSVVFEREAGGTPGMEVADLAYQTATPFRTTVAGTETSVRVNTGGGVLGRADFNLAFGATERWVIVSDPDSVLALVRPATVERERAESGVDIQVFHSSEDAGPVDVHVAPASGGVNIMEPEASNLMFRSASATLPEQTFQDYFVSLTEVGNTSTSIVDFIGDIASVTAGNPPANLFQTGNSILVLVTGSASSSVDDLDLVFVSENGTAYVRNPIP